MKDSGWSKIVEPYHDDEVMYGVEVNEVLIESEIMMDTFIDNVAITESEVMIHSSSSDSLYENEGLEVMNETTILDNYLISSEEVFWHDVTTDKGSINPNSFQMNNECELGMLILESSSDLDSIKNCEPIVVDVAVDIDMERFPGLIEDNGNNGHYDSTTDYVADIDNVDPNEKESVDSESTDHGEKHSDTDESKSTDQFSFDSDTECEIDELEIGKSQHIGNTRPFDLKILRDCVEAGEKVINMVDGKDVVLVVGKTGVGKSLFIQGIAGKKIASHVHVSTCYGTNISTNVFEAVDPLPGFAIGHNKASKTKSINCFCQSDTVYIDSPGWEDTAGSEVDIATSIMLSQVIKHARTLRLVVLISYVSLFEDRGGAIRGVLKLVHTFVSNFDKDKKSFVFLFTHTNEVDIPTSLDEARSCLTDEILRIRRDTDDSEIKKVLSFMTQSLQKKYRFVDVLHPLTADFASIATFIETSVSPIQDPAPMENCGMTVKSELTLIGQAQHMLNLVRRLLQSIEQRYNPDAIYELNEIKDMFGYLSKYVALGEIEKASTECDCLFEQHINRQRLYVEEQLDRVRGENDHFDEGNMQLLKDSMLQLDIFGISSQYTEKLLQDAAEKCLSRGKNNFSYLDRTIKDFLKIKLLKDGFLCCKEQHDMAHEWLQSQVDWICDVVSIPKDHDFECFDVEGISEHARCIAMLGAIVREITLVVDYGIVTSAIVPIFDFAKHQICSLADVWASGTPLLDNQNDDCNVFIIQKLSERASKLEALVAILDPHKEQLVFTNVVENVDQALDDIEALVRIHVQSMCTTENDNIDIIERNMAFIASIELDFRTLPSQRWQCTSHICRDMISSLRNKLMMKALKLENAARACSENGLSNGEEDGKLYKDFKSYLWFDHYDNNQDFVRTGSNTAYDTYHHRMAFVLEKLTECSAKVKVLSEKNVNHLKLYCKLAAEFKQFQKFKSVAVILQLCDEGGKKIARDGIQPYIKELREQAKQLCSRWLTLVKEVSDNEELKVLTKKLDTLLAEIEVIDKFGDVVHFLKTAAASAKQSVMSTLQAANIFSKKEFKKLFEYERKASILRCFSSIQGFPRIDCQLLGCKQFSEWSCDLVSNHAADVKRLMNESVDTNKIEAALNEFRKAKILDPFTNDEAAKNLLSIESLFENQAETLDKIIEDIVVRKDFVEFRKLLRPLSSSHDVVNTNKLHLYSLKIAEVLNLQIQKCEEKLHLEFSKQDAQYVMDTLTIVIAANEEIGSIMKSSTTLKLSDKKLRLQSLLNKKIKALADKFLKGEKNDDFYAMGVNYHLATIIYELGGPYLDQEANDTYHSANTKWNHVQTSVSKKATTFLSSLFQDFVPLRRALSNLKQASEIDGIQWLNLGGLYKTCVSDLSNEVTHCLLDIRDKVDETFCYYDGIPVLKAFETALKLGMTYHLNPLPFDCHQVVLMWMHAQSKLEGICASPRISSHALKEVNGHMDQFKKTVLVQGCCLSTEKSYRQLQNQMEQRVLQEYDESNRYLQQQDSVLLKRSLDRLTCITENLGTHIPLASVHKCRLENTIIKVFVELCLKAVKLLEIEDVVNFEAVFPELRLLAIHFPFVLNSNNAIQAFDLAAQLVHDILRSRIDNLYSAVCDHDFLAICKHVEYNRTHGAFLADHYGLLFEELKHHGKLRESKWLNQIWDICRENFATGRDLVMIKSFAVLGIVPSASAIEIRNAYKQKVRRENHGGEGHITSNFGDEFRRAQDAQDTLLASSRFSTSSQLFDALIGEIPSRMEKGIKGWLSDQDYQHVSNLLEQLYDFKRVCTLVNPPLEFDETVHCVNKIVTEHILGIRMEVERCWYERNYQELNLCMEDLRILESYLKSFPNVFPKSWTFIEEVKSEITSKGKQACFLLKNKETARESFNDFKRCIMEMGAILFEIQIFSSFTKDIMYDVLESCLHSDWGYPYLFKVGLSLQKGDDSTLGAHNSIGKSIVAEFSHFKEVLTMVWNEETSQKPPEVTVEDIKVWNPKELKIDSLLPKSEKETLLRGYHAFEAAYVLHLSEYLPTGSDLGKLSTQIVELANSLKPLQCSGGWTVQVKDAIPQLLAGIFVMFTIIKSGESYNRILDNSREARLGHSFLLKPHNIQILTLLQLLGCDNSSKGSLENKLMQIRTGEGKSMILGAAAAILGLLGFRVRCVCYSDYLSSRDYSLFEPLFKRLHLEDLVSYSMITKLSEDTTARIGDIRGLTERLLKKELEQSHSSYTQNNTKKNMQARPSEKIKLYCPVLSKQSSATKRNIRKGRKASSAESTLSAWATTAKVAASNIACSIFQANLDPEEILLVDEVDVFFGSDFYGRTYNQVAELRRPEVSSLIIDIWDNYKQDRRSLADVQASPHYHCLIKAMPSFQFLIDQEIRLMLDHVSHVDDEPYIFDPDQDRIGYKVLDTISYNVTFGYQTVFAYLKEADNGNLKNKKATLDRVLFIPVSCGQFSYADINPARILGVSGTLEAMGKVESDILFDYKIEKYVIVPSVYGKSNFAFDKTGEGIYIEQEKSDYFQKICDEIHKKTQKKRAVIVFFKDGLRLTEFMNSPFYQKLGRQKNILTENMDLQAKEFSIKKAAISGQITLCPAVFGRGTDFFCKDEKTEDAGGVHIIQAFFSTETSEEVQIRGRTARQGKKGSYQMILLESDLEGDFGFSKGEASAIRRDRRYELLNSARKTKSDQNWNAVLANLELATKRDKATHLYFRSLRQGNQNEAEKQFKKLYAMIKNPPVPDEIAVDIAFLLDITGSMTPYAHHAFSVIDSIMSSNGSLLTTLQQLLPDTNVKLRFGFLAYRDIDDKDMQFIECTRKGGAHFTEIMSEILEFIKSNASIPSGGKDICEDHLGAIDRCVNWKATCDWAAPIKFAVLFTDSPAHGLAPPYIAKLSNDDNYAATHPNGLTPASVASSMIAKRLNLLICSYNPAATAHMEQTIAKEYLYHPDNSTGREVKCISMVPQNTIISASRGKLCLSDQPRHMIFILDESFSMLFSWGWVVKAFGEYIARRQQNQNEEDLVSVVQFSEKARVTIEVAPIRNVSKDLVRRGSGTKFAPAAEQGSYVALKTPMSHRPMLVFMSDGGTDDAPSAATIITSLNRQVRKKYGADLELHVIAFGFGANTQQLSHISRSSPLGRLHNSSDTIQLTNIFVDIARGQEVATTLQNEIAKEISEAVSDTLSLEYLS